jgi:hypothetical protein
LKPSDQRCLHVKRSALKFAMRLEKEDRVTFVRVPGLIGKVYVPKPCPAASKKHPCRDCFGCQRCSDDRCCLCRSVDPGQDRNKEENHESDILPR